MNKILVLIWLLAFPVLESLSNWIDSKYRPYEKISEGGAIIILLFYILIAIYLGS